MTISSGDEDKKGSLLVPQSEPKWHPAYDSKQCPVCISPNRTEIEELYLRCALKLSSIATMSLIDAELLELHYKALGFNKKRVENTEDLLAHAVNSAFDRGVFDSLDGDQIVKLLQHQDKKLGKVKDYNTGDRRPPVVIFTGVPMPMGVSGADVKVMESGEALSSISATFEPETEPFLITNGDKNAGPK